MVKKVTLDTLDIEETIVSLSGKEAEAETAADKPFTKPFIPRRRLISALIILIMLGVGGLSYWRQATKKTVVHHEPIGKKVQSIAGPAKRSMTALNDFLVTIKDDKGNERVMLCDLTVELSDNQHDGFMKNISEVRNIIYSAFTKKRTTMLMKPEGKNLLKEEISTELVNLLGKNIVKSIYFTKFVVL